MKNGFLIVLLMLYISGSAQRFVLQIRDAGTGKKMAEKSYSGIKARDEAARTFMQDLYAKGYLDATADSVRKSGDSLEILLQQGNVYRWLELANGNVREEALRSAGFKTRAYKNAKLQFGKVRRVLKNTQTWYENNGYPFARVFLDSIAIADNTAKAKLYSISGEINKIDSLTWRGSAKISKVFLYNYLGIKPGDVYNEQAILQIEDRVKELPFITQTKPADVFLLESQSLIRLYLDNRKASSFSGLVGFLPNNEKDGKLLITGEGVVKLRNALGKGEAFDAEWKRLQAATQSLSIRVTWPFLFNLPIGVDGAFNLYKRDTSFLNLQQNLGIQYLQKGNDYLKAFVEQRSSNRLGVAASQNLTIQPDYADVSSLAYGLEWNRSRLDYRYNPRKGFRILARSAAGTRKLSQNNVAQETQATNLNTRLLQVSGLLDADAYIPVFRQATINIGLNGAFLSTENMYENELSRIGGNSSLRGFDEESIFASSYLIGTLEYRYLLEQNSYLFLFGNGAWYENVAVNRNIRDWPYGFGAGLSFETKAGIFVISYALGSQFSNPIEFRSAKVHLGISSLF
jgi:outer membrane protein assembly factor BamA